MGRPEIVEKLWETGVSGGWAGKREWDWGIAGDVVLSFGRERCSRHLTVLAHSAEGNLAPDWRRSYAFDYGTELLANDISCAPD